jgi:hypothetical protein
MYQQYLSKIVDVDEDNHGERECGEVRGETGQKTAPGAFPNET